MKNKNMYDTLPQPKGKMNMGDDQNPEAMDHDDEGGAEASASQRVALSDHCFPKAKDGESVKGQIEGTVSIEDGERFLAVQKIDGYPVGVTSDEATPTPDEPPANMQEAASDFFSKKKESA